jgi:hypothetical protein
MSKRNRTNDEIEALLREGAEGEICETGGRVSHRVVARLRSDPALRMRGGAGRIGAFLDDEGQIPRWFLAAAVVAIMALVGWLLVGPSGAPGPGSGGTAPSIAGANALPDPAMFDASAQRLLALAVAPPNDMLKREARALVGAGWELAGRVLNGIPVELVKPIAEQRGAG